MSQITKSECLFEELCKRRSVRCKRIPVGDSPVADYMIQLGRLKVIAEVKEIAPNKRDLELIEREERGEQPGRVAPTKRVRDLIGTAYRQLKNSCGEDHPGLIVVYNNSPIWNFVDSWTVTNAMFGGYGMSIAANPTGGWDVVRRGFGGKQKTTRTQSRALSALCVLEESGFSELRLIVFHNPYARIPIPADSLYLLAEKQFIHMTPHDGQFVDWKPMDVEKSQA